MIAVNINLGIGIGWMQFYEIGQRLARRVRKRSGNSVADASVALRANFDLALPGEGIWIDDGMRRTGPGVSTLLFDVLLSRTVATLAGNAQRESGFAVAIFGGRSRQGLKVTCVTFKAARGDRTFEVRGAIGVTGAVYPGMDGGPVGDR